jgi:hypothetical protein
MDPYNEEEFRIAKIMMQCTLNIELGLNSYFNMPNVKEALNILLRKFGDEGDIYFFNDLLVDEIVGMEKDEDHKTKGWNKNLFIKWTNTMQDYNRNSEDDVFKIRAIRDRLYFFFKAEYH